MPPSIYTYLPLTLHFDILYLSLLDYEPPLSPYTTTEYTCPSSQPHPVSELLPPKLQQVMGPEPL